MEISFSKYQATGNDFILIDGLKTGITLNNEQVKKLCNRKFGIGADGLIVAGPSARADVYMDYFNSDGTRAEMCGNGIRCLAAFVEARGETCPPVPGSGRRGREVRVETRAGIKKVESDGRNYAVDMGKPSFDNQAIGFKADEPMWKYSLDVGGRQVETYGVSMGNPHCVILSDNLESVPVEELGPIIENHPLFQNRINVEWMSVESVRELNVKVWERGAGLTLACGTGACAAFAVAGRLSLIGNRAAVSLPGGQVAVELQNDNLVLKGEAMKIFDGDVNIDG